MEHPEQPRTPRMNKRLRYLMTAVLGIVVFVFILMLWNYVPVLGSNESSACIRCHSMAPEYMTWQQSSHSQFQCRECHSESGVSHFLKYQGRVFKEIFLYSRNESVKTVSNSVKSSACLKCHSHNRKYSPSSDTIVPHDKHIAKGIECVECHAGIAHGRIVERGITTQIPADEWTLSEATEQMDFKYTTPRMAICLECHGKRQVTTTCSVCHSKQIVPASHKSRGWEQLHGASAQKDFKPCNLCHSYTLKKPLDLNETNLGGYIKGNTFCYNCHLEKPSAHKEIGFQKRHGQLVKSRGMSNCTTCHSVDKPKESGPQNNFYCNKCHWFK